MAAVAQLKTHIINDLQEFESMEQFKAELIEYLDSMCNFFCK